MSILIKNGFVVTQNQTRDIVQQDVYIEDDRIVEIGKIDHEADLEADATGKIVMPGLINTHCHIAMSIMRGIADDVSFDEFLSRMFKYDANRTREDVFHGSMLGAVEMILSGTTSFVDLYYYEDEIAKAVQQAGLRGFLAWAVLDKEFTTQEGEPLQNCENFIKEWQGNPTIEPLVGLQGCYVCSEETFLASQALAQKYNTLSHFHLAETRQEIDGHKEKTGKHIIQDLSDIGFLDDKVLAAHTVWADDKEIDILAKSGMNVSHCPVSNAKLSVGQVAPVPKMLEKGINVSLGTDGCVSNNSQNLFADMKFTALIHKVANNDPAIMPAQTVLDLATINGAKALGKGEELGSIEVGKKADIILLDTRVPHLTPTSRATILPHLVYSSNPVTVDSSIINGELVYTQGEFMSLDYWEVMENAEVYARKLLGEE